MLSSDEFSSSSSDLISSSSSSSSDEGIYKVNVKPNNQIATRAADHHCK